MKKYKINGKSTRKSAAGAALIPVLFAALAACSCGSGMKVPVKDPGMLNFNMTPETRDSIYTEVEVWPVFPGGDNALRQYLAENASYPEAARRDGIHGIVFVKFCIDTAGRVCRLSVTKSVAPLLDEEALRVVQTLPPFIPGRDKGRTVAVWFTIPVTFMLR